MVRVQPAESVSVAVVEPHAPPWHTGSVRVRVRLPDSAHIEAKEQLSYGPMLEAPQLTLVVDRAHPAVSVSVTCTALQLLLAQSGSVRTRVRLPEVEQVAAYEQALYALKVVVPHAMPSVIRMQAWFSAVSTFPHAPAPVHSLSERERLCVPLLAQAAPPSQVLHPVKVVVPQPTPAVVKPLAGQAAALPVQRSS